MNVRQWNRFNRQQDALVMNSTRAGQNVINGVKRPMRNATFATQSNPTGTRMVFVAPRRENPLLTTERLVFGKDALNNVAPNYVNANGQSASESLNNSIRKANGKYTPMTVTFGDCCKHNAAKQAAL
jgi:hypothetical protein